MTTRLVHLIAPALAAASIPVSAAVYEARLPDPIAVHWQTGGTPDVSVGLWTAAGGLTAVLLLVVFRMVRAAHRTPHAATARSAITIAHAAAGLVASLWWCSVGVQLDAPTWRDAGALGATAVGICLAATVLLGAFGWLLARMTEGPSRPAPATGTGPGESARPAPTGTTYRTRVAGRSARLLPVVALVVTLVLAGVGAIGTAATIVATVVALAVWAVLDVQVVAGPEGFDLAVGRWSWPRLHVPLAAIEDVTVESLNPLAYGGFGYRARPEVRAVVLRRGTAVRIQRTDAVDLLITLPDANRVASTLAGNLADPDHSPG